MKKSQAVRRLGDILKRELCVRVSDIDSERILALIEEEIRMKPPVPYSKKEYVKDLNYYWEAEIDSVKG